MARRPSRPLPNVKSVRIWSDEMPDARPWCRVWAGQTDLGAALEKIAGDGDAVLSVKPDDIGDGEPVNAARVILDGVHSPVWSRSPPKAD